MQVICHPQTLSGEITAIPSKSDAHRILICAALADNKTVVKMDTRFADDVEATMRCLKALGANFEVVNGGVIVTPIAVLPENPVLDCGESGSTLRFMLPVVAALGCGGRFEGQGRLPSRPIGPIIDAFRKDGLSVDKDSLPLTIKGKLSSNNYQLPGNISSQFITGFPFALAINHGGRIVLNEKLESAAYVDMTLDTLKQFGIEVESTENGFMVPENQKITSPNAIMVEGDWSNMCFYLTAGALNGPIKCTHLTPDTKQGDAAVIRLLQQFGADITVDENKDTILVSHKSLQSIEVDVREIPDMVPILSVIAAVSTGTTKITGAGRLRIKESDRITTVVNMINNLGGDAKEGEDYLIIHGKNHLKGGSVDCAGDHRIAMAGAIAATVCSDPVILNGAEAVNKSYPRFFEDYQSLGGKIDVINHGRKN